MVELLLSESDIVRRPAVQDVLGMTLENQDVIVGALGESLPLQEDAKLAFASLTDLAAGSERLAPEVETMLQRPALMQKVKAQWVPMFRKMPPVLKTLAEADGLPPAVTKAAKTNLEAIAKAGRGA